MMTIRTLATRLLPRPLARRLGLLPQGPTRFITYRWDASSSPVPKWESGTPLFFTAYREGILGSEPPLPPMPHHATNWPPLLIPPETNDHE